jgi:Ca2+-transporting ATPase
VLIGAAIVSGLLGEWIDTGAILAIVLLNGFLGFVQEYRAEQSLAALKTLAVTYARVIRGGSRRSLSSTELVPGDIIDVEAGDHIPADARLIHAAALRTQEAALTGESTPVDKSGGVLPDNDLPLADRRNMLFLGTTVTGGKGRALIVATGRGTELGRIATLMTSVPVEPTPLQRRLEQFGHVLLLLSLGIVVVVFVLGLWRGEPVFDMFLTAVSLAVAAIPEGLPAIVTTTLALGVMRMVTRHALIRRLPAVETLGAATVICTDKTGTLTKNEMTVTRLALDGLVYEVTGEGYGPEGDIIGGDPREGGLQQLLLSALLCNDATLKESRWQLESGGRSHGRGVTRCGRQGRMAERRPGAGASAGGGNSLRFRTQDDDGGSTIGRRHRGLCEGSPGYSARPLSQDYLSVEGRGAAAHRFDERVHSVHQPAVRRASPPCRRPGNGGHSIKSRPLTTPRPLSGSWSFSG